MIDITEVKNHVECKISVRLTGAPEVAVKYTRPVRTMLPFHVVITYVQGDDGQSWQASNVRTTGTRILKPGPNGEQRLGKDHHMNDWYGYGSKPVLKDLPDWLSKLVDELRPMGEVVTPM